MLVGELGGRLPRGVSPQSLSEWRMQNIARDSENSSEEEFFDAHEDLSDSDDVFAKEMTKWNSNDLLDTLDRPGELDEGWAWPLGHLPCQHAHLGFVCAGDGTGVAKPSGNGLTGASFAEACRIHALFLILHSGNILDQSAGEPSSKQADVQTLAATFDAVARVHFPEALGHVALRLVPCPPICAAAYALVSNLSPYSHDRDSLSSSQDHIPLAALPLLATSSGSYQHAVATTIARANQAHSTFLHSPEGSGFCGQVVLIGDCVGGILGFDALCQSRAGTAGSRSSSRRGSLTMEPISPELGSRKDPLAEGAGGTGQTSPEPRLLPPPQEQSDVDSVHQQHNFLCSVPQGEVELRRSSYSSGSALDGGEGTAARLDFKVSGFFLFGSPLGLMHPACEQIYNLFHAADPCASRLEPLLAKAFHAVPPLGVPRYQKYPLGDGTSALLAEALQTHSTLFLGDLELTAPTTPTSCFGGFWRGNETGEPPAPSSTSEVVKILERWWGPKRIDYSLYCPDALTAFPTITLPHLFHASYWESSDVVAFILRQVIEKERPQLAECEESSVYSPAIPREKWQRKRTQVKIRNVTSNHRASDVIVCEGRPQVLSGRFMYGPLDVVTLTGEKVDVYIMTQPLSGKWLHYGTEVTSSSGRLAFLIPPDKALGIGMYPVRMVVRGDHSYAEAFLTVVARSTEAVVFSIDGSFTASVSIMGSDPKVRAGAVDVVRHWQDSGYMIIYVTGRPDMQKHRVVAWLSQHNFPHGVVSFCDGLTHDPLRQKAAFLQNLRTEAEVTIVAGYGSTKDISVYSSLGLSPTQIYIVGRTVKKFQNQCQFLSEGYVAHLAQLETASLAHSPKGAPRPTLGKGTYGCPAPVDFLRKQSQLLRSRGQSQAEREGGPPAAPRAKARSISLKLESEE
uniref:DDHD domain-containing protein n=1 Tax=Gopherus agassizii TaxID=38772 RepID=A0A452HWE7_9SAUR